MEQEHVGQAARRARCRRARVQRLPAVRPDRHVPQPGLLAGGHVRPALLRRDFLAAFRRSARRSPTATTRSRKTWPMRPRSAPRPMRRSRHSKPASPKPAPAPATPPRRPSRKPTQRSPPRPRRSKPIWRPGCRPPKRASPTSAGRPWRNVSTVAEDAAAAIAEKLGGVKPSADAVKKAVAGAMRG